MTVRRADKNDAKAMAKVSVMTWKAAYAHILPAEVLKGLNADKRAERIRQNLERGEEVWLAELNGKIIGYASAGRNRSKEVVADVELHTIYVLPSYHGRGVGRTLLKATLPKLIKDGATTMCVFAFKQNELARRFYCNLGAEPVGEAVFNVSGVDYPDQSYLWTSIRDLESLIDSQLISRAE